MLSYPGVRRRRAFVPDVRRRADETELRPAAQSVFVPIDPDVPSLIPGEPRFQVVPRVLRPVWATLRPETQIGQPVHAEPWRRGRIEVNFLAKVRAPGGPGGDERGLCGEGRGEGGREGGGVSGGEGGGQG